MWITFCQEVLLGQTIANIVFLQLSMDELFCYTVICGKIYNFKKGKKSKKTRFFSTNEVSWWTKGFEKKKSKGSIEAFHKERVNV